MSTQDDLLNALKKGREDFLKAIDGLSNDARQEAGVIDHWSVKDILAHINLWEAEMIKLLWQLRTEQETSSVLLADTNVDEMNARWYLENQSRSLERVLTDFHAVRTQTIRQVQASTEHDLSTPRRYPKLGDTPLKDWIAGESYEHEAEHAAQILEWRKRQDV